MDLETHPHSDVAWREVLARFPDSLDLDESVREHGATLLRLALACPPRGTSLRAAATWATACGIAKLSDVGLLKRLKKADSWLSHIAGLRC